MQLSPIIAMANKIDVDQPSSTGNGVYPAAPMEQAVIAITERICGSQG